MSNLKFWDLNTAPCICNMMDRVIVVVVGVGGGGGKGPEALGC